MKGIQVALMRGINVGTARRVAMADLRALIEETGCSNVRTLLNSGNAVFVSPVAGTHEMALRIEKALASKLGVSSRAMVLTAEELADVVDGNPLVNVADNSSRLLVGILADPADQEKLREIAGKDWGTEKIALGTGPAGGKKPAPVRPRGTARAVYMWMPMGVIESKLNAAVGKALGDRVTSRNWATVLKLKDLAGQTGR